MKRSSLHPPGAVALVLLTAAAGCTCRPASVRCEADPPPPVAAAPVGPPLGDADGLVLSQTVVPTELAPGETLEITLSVENPTGAPVSKRYTNGCVRGFALWAEDGSIAAPPPPMCTMNVPTIIYETGAPFTTSWTWTWDGTNPAPGTYVLHAGLGPRGTQAAAPGTTVTLGRRGRGEGEGR